MYVNGKRTNIFQAATLPLQGHGILQALGQRRAGAGTAASMMSRGTAAVQGASPCRWTGAPPIWSSAALAAPDA